MSDAKSTVELIFQGIDRTSEATQSALNNAQKFSSSVQNVTQPLSDFSIAATKFEGALLASGAAITGFALKAAGDFDSAFREISTLIDEPIENLGEFRRAILDYASQSSMGLSDITNAVYNAISAGVDYVDTLEFIETAEQAAIAGKADLNTALKALLGPMNAYGVEADQAQKFSDSLFTTVKGGVTTLPELEASLGKLTGIAAPLGIEFGELGAAIATLTSVGISTPEAVTALGAAINNLINPSERAKEIYRDLKIEFGAAAIESSGFAGKIQEIGEKAGGNVQVISDLFGSINGFKAAMVLTGPASEKFVQELQNQENRAGATAEAYDRMSGQFKESNQGIVNALQGLLIDIGTPLLDAYGGVAEAIAAVFKAAGVSVRDPDQLGGVVETLNEVFRDVEGVIRNFVDLLPEAFAQADFSGLSNNLRAVIDGIKTAFSGVDLSTADGIASAMTTIADSIGLLGSFVGGQIESFQTIISFFSGAATSLSKLNPEWAKFFGSIGGYAIQLNTILPAFDTLLLILIAARGGGLAAAAAKVAGALAAIGPALAAIALPLAAGAGIWKIGELVSILWDWRDAAREAKDAQEAAAGTIALADSELQEVASNLGLSVDSYKEFWDLVEGGKVIYDEVANAWVLASEKHRDATEDIAKDYDALVNEASLAADINNELAESFAQIGLDWDSASGTFRANKKDLDETSSAIDDAEQSTEKWIKTIVDGVPTFTQAGRDISGSFEDQEKAAEKAFKQTDAYMLRLMELQSNERIRLIEIKAELNVAEIEAQTRRVESAFESLNVGIESTGNTITELFGLLTQSDSFFDRMDLRRAIERETKFREQEFALQRELIETQIDNLRAKTDALDRGDAFISVDGAGLQPHLEAFMWEILRAIQVRVNEDGLEMLLGTA